MSSKFLKELNENHKETIIEQITSKLDEDSLKDFWVAMENKNISSSAITKSLESFGIVCSTRTIANMRCKKNK